MPSKIENDRQALIDLKTQIQGQLDIMDAKIAEIEAGRAGASLKLRELAVGLHTLLCTLVHGEGDGECTWNTIAEQDSADGADWAEAAHALWLSRASAGITKLRDLGYTVEEP